MEKTTKNNKTWKIIKTVLNVVFYTFITVLVLFSISNLGVKNTSDIPNIFNKGFLTVQTSSMDGDKEDSFTKNDMIFVTVVTDKNRDKLINAIEAGDIITFEMKVLDDDGKDLGRILNTHRVVEVSESDGAKIFITQGDKVAQDPNKAYGGKDGLNYIETVMAKDVLGIYTSKIEGVGATMKYLQTSNGFLFVIVLPVAAFFIFVTLSMIVNFMKVKQFKSEEERKKDHDEQIARAKAELEAEKEKLRAELLAEMKKNNNEEKK